MLFSVHHTCASHVAQFFYQSSSNCHYFVPPSINSCKDIVLTPNYICYRFYLSNANTTTIKLYRLEPFLRNQLPCYLMLLQRIRLDDLQRTASAILPANNLTARIASSFAGIGKSTSSGSQLVSTVATTGNAQFFSFCNSDFSFRSTTKEHLAFQAYL